MAAEYLERLGARIRARREELGLTREEVARAMPGKTSGNQVYRWEKGLHQPSPESLEALARILKVDVPYFLVDEPRPEQSDLIGALSDREALEQMMRRFDEGMARISREIAELRQRLPPESPQPRGDTAARGDGPAKDAPPRSPRKRKAA